MLLLVCMTLRWFASFSCWCSELNADGGDITAKRQMFQREPYLLWQHLSMILLINGNGSSFGNLTFGKKPTT